MVSRAASNIFRLMKLTKVNILAAASVALLIILLAKHSETRALQQQIGNLEETALELESCQAKQNDEKNIQLQMEVANLKAEVALKDEMNIQLQKDVENLKTEVELMDAMNAQLQRDVETLNAEDTWLGRFGFPRHLKVQKDIENLNTEAEIKDAMTVQLQRDIENLKAEARRKDDKNIQLQKDIENLKTEALTAELANFQVDHEKIGQSVNVNVQVLMATFVIGALMAMLRRYRQTQKVKQVHEMPWELHGRMKEQQAIATRKLQGAWRRKAARLEERKSREYKEARLKTLWRKMLARRIQRTWRAKVPLLRHRRQRSCAKETAYDAVFAFESLSNFLTTGEIEFLQAPESKFDFTRESRYRIVAVVGLFDKGKTLLINKLFGKNLPSGKKCPTTGISFLWIEDLEMLVLDSAGVQRPVSQCDGAVQSIQDARATESFMFEMISRIADYMIFVVNDFTWFEQEYVSMLHRKYEQMLRHTELIVVHNLRDTYEAEEAKDLFDQQIKKCYKGGSSPLDELTYVAVMQEGVPPVNHVALCKEMTLAGDKYNKKNIEHLKNQLRFRHMLGRSMSLTDSLRKELERLIPTFAYVERAPEQMPSSEKTLSVLYETCKVVDKKESGLSGLSTFEMVCKDYGKVGCMRLKAISDAKVSMKTQGVINPLGEIITHDVTFEPNVNVYDRTLQDGIERVIRIECPGVQQEDIKWKAFQSGVKISIRKQKPIEETTVQAVEPIIQHHGPWERAFEFENGSGRFDDFGNMAGGKKLTKEDEILLQNFSRTVSTKSSALFYANAFFVSAIPLWLFWRIHQMDPYSSGIMFVVMTLASTWLVAFAYKNVKFQLKHKIAQRRDASVTKEVSMELDSNKKLTRQEKDERILWKKNKVAETEAITFSIFYNNALYLFLVLIASFYVLRTFNPAANYLLSTSIAGGVLALLSTGSSS